LNNFENILNLVKPHPEKILNDWRSRCKMIGEKISIIEGEKVKFGVFENIDDDGFLILRQGDKREKILYGDVSIR